MKILILCKNKEKVKMIEKCSGEDLVIMASAILKESICKLVKEKKVNKEEIVEVIKELLGEKVFTNNDKNIQ